jgi:hypothetical protein
VSIKIRFLINLFLLDYELELTRGIVLSEEKYNEHYRWHKNGILDIHYYFDGNKFYKKFTQMLPDGKIFEIANYDEEGRLDGEYENHIEGKKFIFRKGEVSEE